MMPNRLMVHGGRVVADASTRRSAAFGTLQVRGITRRVVNWFRAAILARTENNGQQTDRVNAEAGDLAPEAVRDLAR